MSNPTSHSLGSRRNGGNYNSNQRREPSAQQQGTHSTWDAYSIGKIYPVADYAPITAAPSAEGAGIEKNAKRHSDKYGPEYTENDCHYCLDHGYFPSFLFAIAMDCLISARRPLSAIGRLGRSGATRACSNTVMALAYSP